MLISKSHQFIFLAVPKTASSSIEHALAEFRSPLTGCFNKHATCTKLSRDLPPEIWDSYFKFAVVRNPYDTLQSWYFYRQREDLANPKHPRHNLYTGNISFDEFVETFSQKHIMLNQIYWTAPPALGGENQLDFVCRYENLAADFGEVCRRLDIPCPTLPTIRSSSNDASAKNLWNRHSRRLANDYFKEDFEHFDYEVLNE